MSETSDCYRLAVTPGEPAGIGPDLCIQLAQQQQQHQLVVIADAQLLQQRAQQLGLALTLVPFDPQLPVRPSQPGQLCLLNQPLAQPALAGQLNPANAGYVLNTLTCATQGCLDGDFDALVTAPVHKGVINDAGTPFSGHTEFLMALTDSEQVVMMLACEGLKVALVTTHLPLAQIPAAITPDRLSQISRILDRDLRQRFGIEQPRILVCGLNPHAGEGGHLGLEEQQVIEPTLESLRAEGLNLIGPLPADTLFTAPQLERGDAVLAMYHDQGLPVLKYKGFGHAVNITLGMPIIRTSVDHGTALDLAGSGRASSDSLKTAIDYAAQMTTAHKRTILKRAEQAKTNASAAPQNPNNHSLAARPPTAGALKNRSLMKQSAQGHQARKRFGQNFLQDHGVIRRIIRAINPKPGQHLIEIGPGLGALTEELLAGCGELDVVELDRDLIPKLQRQFASYGDKLRIHQADALKFDFQALTADQRPLRVVGNLPYNISTPLIFHLLSYSGVFEDMYFMLQKEVVDRLAAQPGDSSYGRLGIMAQYYCEVSSLFLVHPEAFDPQPKVDSAIVKLRPYAEPPHPAASVDDFALLVRTAFGQRRKTLRNNLKTLLSVEQIEAEGIDPGLRPEKLSLPEFVRLANSYTRYQAAPPTAESETCS